MHPPASAKWDQRYLRLACIVAHWSKDPSTGCGAILVRPDRSLASVGYNGFPRNLPDDPILYADRASKYPRTVHSEWNAIRSCKDASLAGYTVYAWPMPPCDLCTAALVQRGVSRVVCPSPSAEKLERWALQFALAEETWTQSRAQVDYVALDQGPCTPLFIPGAAKWDVRMLQVAAEVASWSKHACPAGAVIMRPEKTISSLGFAGFPKGVDDAPLLSGNAQVIAARLLHAEFNAMLMASDSSLAGHTAFLWPQLPDLRGTVHLLHEGITRIVSVAEGVDHLQALEAAHLAGGELVKVSMAH